MGLVRRSLAAVDSDFSMMTVLFCSSMLGGVAETYSISCFASYVQFKKNIRTNRTVLVGVGLLISAVFLVKICFG